MKILQYLYYKFYRSQNYVGNNDVAPEFASLMLAFTFILYIYTFVALLNILTGIKIPLGNNRASAAGFGILMIATCYYIMAPQGKWKRIVKKFENESEQERKRGNIFAILYAIGSFVSFIGLLIIKMLQNQGKI